MKNEKIMSRIEIIANHFFNAGGKVSFFNTKIAPSEKAKMIKIILLSVIITDHHLLLYMHCCIKQHGNYP